MQCVQYMQHKAWPCVTGLATKQVASGPPFAAGCADHRFDKTLMTVQLTSTDFTIKVLHDAWIVHLPHEESDARK